MTYQKNNQKSWSRLPVQATNNKSEEYNPDDEDLSDCLEMITSHRKENRPRISSCPRCGEDSKVNARFPYCPGCNWDSLHDPCWSHE